MRKRALGVVAGTIMTLAVASAAFAAVPSHISIGFNHSTEFFHGAVTSSNTECQAHRTVKVFKETANGPSLQGSVMSDSNGRWKIEVMHAHGHYFAMTPKQTVMSTDCGKAKSQSIDVM